MGEPGFFFQCVFLVFIECFLLELIFFCHSLYSIYFCCTSLVQHHVVPKPMCLAKDIGNAIYVHKSHFFHYVFLYVVSTFHFNLIRNKSRSNIKYHIIIHIDGVFHYI